MRFEVRLTLSFVYGREEFGESSIKIRSDVPDILNGTGASLSAPLKVGAPAAFEGASGRGASS